MSDQEIKKNMNGNYLPIPLSEIDQEARLIAVAWIEGYEKIGSIELEQKHKLASDFMNYSRRQINKFNIGLADLVREKQALQAELSTLQKSYNDLGVKFDKELERWQERDADELNKRKILEAELTKARKDLGIATNSYDRRGESQMVLIKEKMERDAVIAKAKEELLDVTDLLLGLVNNGVLKRRPDTRVDGNINRLKKVLAEIETLTK